MTDLELLPLLNSPEKLGEYTDEQLLQLADEIAEFVKTMDTQAQAHPARTVQLIPLKGGNAKRVRRALKALRD